MIPSEEVAISKYKTILNVLKSLKSDLLAVIMKSSKDRIYWHAFISNVPSCGLISRCYRKPHINGAFIVLVCHKADCRMNLY